MFIDSDSAKFAHFTVIASVPILRGDKIARWLRASWGRRRFDSSGTLRYTARFIASCARSRVRSFRRGTKRVQSAKVDVENCVTSFFFADSLSRRWDHRDSLFARGYVCRGFCNHARDFHIQTYERPVGNADRTKPARWVSRRWIMQRTCFGP